MTIKPGPTTTEGGHRRERTSGSGEMDTRDRVINAAIECIIDLGFYRVEYERDSSKSRSDLGGHPALLR